MLKNKHDADPQPFSGVSTYTEAVEDFSTSAAEFLKCVPILVKTRDAYRRAMAISSEVRKILDTGDETLRRTMSHIEQAIHVEISEKKKPEVIEWEGAGEGPSKVAPFRPTAETSMPSDAFAMITQELDKKFNGKEEVPVQLKRFP